MHIVSGKDSFDIKFGVLKVPYIHAVDVGSMLGWLEELFRVRVANPSCRFQWLRC